MPNEMEKETMNFTSKFPLILTSIFTITLTSCNSYHHDYLVQILSDFVYKEVTDLQSLKIDSIDWVKCSVCSLVLQDLFGGHPAS